MPVLSNISNEDKKAYREECKALVQALVALNEKIEVDPFDESAFETEINTLPKTRKTYPGMISYHDSRNPTTINISTFNLSRIIKAPDLLQTAMNCHNDRAITCLLKAGLTPHSAAFQTLLFSEQAYIRFRTALIPGALKREQLTAFADDKMFILEIQQYTPGTLYECQNFILLLLRFLVKIDEEHASYQTLIDALFKTLDNMSAKQYTNLLFYRHLKLIHLAAINLPAKPFKRFVQRYYSSPETTEAVNERVWHPEFDYRKPPSASIKGMHYPGFTVLHLCAFLGNEKTEHMLALLQYTRIDRNAFCYAGQTAAHYLSEKRLLSTGKTVIQTYYSPNTKNRYGSALADNPEALPHFKAKGTSGFKALSLNGKITYHYLKEDAALYATTYLYLARLYQQQNGHPLNFHVLHSLKDAYQLISDLKPGETLNLIVHALKTQYNLVAIHEKNAIKIICFMANKRYQLGERWAEELKDLVESQNMLFEIKISIYFNELRFFTMPYLSQICSFLICTQIAGILREKGSDGLVLHAVKNTDNPHIKTYESPPAEIGLLANEISYLAYYYPDDPIIFGEGGVLAVHQKTFPGEKMNGLVANYQAQFCNMLLAQKPRPPFTRDIFAVRSIVTLPKNHMEHAVTNESLITITKQTATLIFFAAQYCDYTPKPSKETIWTSTELTASKDIFESTVAALKNPKNRLPGSETEILIENAAKALTSILAASLKEKDAASPGKNGVFALKRQAGCNPTEDRKRLAAQP